MAHTAASSKGLTYAALAPELRVIAPWRIWDLDSRTAMIAYALVKCGALGSLGASRVGWLPYQVRTFSKKGFSPSLRPSGSVCAPASYGPYQSAHHSATLPCMSNRPGSMMRPAASISLTAPRTGERSVIVHTRSTKSGPGSCSASAGKPRAL